MARRREMMQWYADLLDALADRRAVNLQSKTLEDMENQGSQDAGQAAQETSDAGRLDGVVKIYSMDLDGGPSLLPGAPLLNTQFQTCEMDTDALNAVSTKKQGIAIRRWAPPCPALTAWDRHQPHFPCHLAPQRHPECEASCGHLEV